MNIKDYIDIFFQNRDVYDRETSFDYCYNYFYDFYKNNKLEELISEENLMLSSLQIGFYLASWGMFRSSSFLLNKSVKHFENLIKTISKMDLKIWEIDVPNYDENNIKLLLETKNKIYESLKDNNRKPTETLVTKVMLGVFSNVPAFDTYFSKTFKVSSLNKKSLQKIKEFYEKNKKDFDSYEIYTLDFKSGKETNVKYKIAKLVDMYGFTKGLKN